MLGISSGFFELLSVEVELIRSIKIIHVISALFHPCFYINVLARTFVLPVVIRNKSVSPVL